MQALTRTIKGRLPVGSATFRPLMPLDPLLRLKLRRLQASPNGYQALKRSIKCQSHPHHLREAQVRCNLTLPEGRPYIQALKVPLDLTTEGVMLLGICHCIKI